MNSVSYEDRHSKLYNDYYEIRKEQHEFSERYMYGMMGRICEFIRLQSKRRKKMLKSNTWKSYNSLLESIQRKMEETYSEYLVKECPNLEFKKEKIIALKLKFGNELERHHNSAGLIAEAISCNRQYVNRFKYINNNGKYGSAGKAIIAKNDNGLIYDMKYYLEKKQHELKPSIDVKKRVLKRDDYKCVRCGSEKDIQIHHVIPVCNPISTSKMENLASLCRGCHLKAHLGDFASLGRDYDLAYSSQHEFWEEWVKGEKTTPTSYHNVI